MVKCKYCESDRFTLINIGEHSYWYHYGDYDKGCKQRLSYEEIVKYVSKRD